MKEELIRIENGIFLYDSARYMFDIDICRGECIGIFVDDHEFDGTAYEGVFSAKSTLLEGRFFAEGKRISPEAMKAWIRKNTVRLNRFRFTAAESNIRDFLLNLGPEFSYGKKRMLEKRLKSESAAFLLKQMGLFFSGKEKLTNLSPAEYYKLAIFRAWLREYSIVILDRISEILPSQDLDHFMNCVQILQGQGTGFIMFELNENFMYRYASRIDIVHNRMLCYRLDPDEYDERLYRILGNVPQAEISTIKQDAAVQKENVIIAENLSFANFRRINFAVARGEIALFRDVHLKLLPILKKYMFHNKDWSSGKVLFNGQSKNPAEIRKMIGKEICIQTELPDRSGGLLFENLSGIENLSLYLIPKTKKKIIRKRIVDSIMHTAEKEFSRELLNCPVKQWSHPDRLKLIYYRWFMVNPDLLICLMPFSGQEISHHSLIIDMLVKCAKRGMAILLISSGVDSIYETTPNQEFKNRLKILL
ncbi:MAG: hypothetical protein Q4B03_01880 [Lachnospiraceae bacterium]|nr:hypothetical protein [Lachnospiraceae bacterium]